jgi:hypothetical protein
MVEGRRRVDACVCMCAAWRRWYEDGVRVQQGGGVLRCPLCVSQCLCIYRPQLGLMRELEKRGVPPLICWRAAETHGRADDAHFKF